MRQRTNPPRGVWRYRRRGAGEPRKGLNIVKRHVTLERHLSRGPGGAKTGAEYSDRTHRVLNGGAALTASFPAMDTVREMLSIAADHGGNGSPVEVYVRAKTGTPPTEEGFGRLRLFLDGDLSTPADAGQPFPLSCERRLLADGRIWVGVSLAGGPLIQAVLVPDPEFAERQIDFASAAEFGYSTEIQWFQVAALGVGPDDREVTEALAS
jgi:hypothetical protein